MESLIPNLPSVSYELKIPCSKTLQNGCALSLYPQFSAYSSFKPCSNLEEDQ